MNGQTKYIIDKLQSVNAKKVLNIGFRYDSDPTIRNFVKSSGGQFDVLEVWEPNCKDIVNREVVDRVILGDARQIRKVIKEFEYDVVLWLHGPEHITWEEFTLCRSQIDSTAAKLVIYQAPIGEHPQDELYGNPYERHITSLSPSMFSELGYQVTLHDGLNENNYSYLKGEKTFSAMLIK